METFIEMFNWDETEARIYNTLITTSGVLGMAIGTLLSSKSINKGRRKATLRWAWPAIIGAFVAQVPLVPCICVGRILCGLTAGHANTIMMKATVETVPSKYLGYYKWMSNFYIALGILFSFSLGGLDLPILPYIGETNWRVIYFMPAVFSLLQIILFGCVYKYEPIAYCIENGRIDEARLFLKQIYLLRYTRSNDNFEELIDVHLEWLRQHLDTEESTVSLEYAMCGKKYRRATWTSVLINVFLMESGHIGFIMYAHRFLEVMLEQTDAVYPTTLQATNVFGVVNFAAVIVALIPVYYYGRKRIFVVGYGTMAVTLGIAGLCIAFDQYILALIAICFYIAIWQTSAGVITSIYASEISILSKNSIFPSKGLALTVSLILHI